MLREEKERSSRVDNDPVSEEMFFTPTMARLLETQGHFDDALFVYKILSRRSPENEGVLEGVKRLEERARLLRR